MKKLKIIKDGEWIEPVRDGYIWECCDCGLRHELNFKLIGKDIWFQAFRVEVT